MTDTANTFLVDLVARAQAGAIAPALERDHELTRLITVLLRSFKNNPIILGPSGIGKTALTYGFAHLLATGRVPAALSEKRLVSIDLSAIIAASDSESETLAIFRSLIEDILKTNGRMIMAINDIKQLIDPAYGRLLKPHIIAGTLRIIAESDMPSYKLHLESDASIMGSLQPVILSEPNPSSAAVIVTAAKSQLEAFHHISIPDALIKDSIALSGRYVKQKYFPEKALDLLDDSAVNAVLSGARELTAAHLAATIAELTGVPIDKVTANEKQRLATMEDQLRKRVIGQDEAVVAVADSMRRARSGMQDPNRPIGTFFFIGSTGIGKTELAKALAEFVFDDEGAIHRMDMSEYMERSSVASLIGPPPGTSGYEQGGLLTEAVRLKPYQVLLFDELEKAHPEILNLLLQVLDEGRLTDSRGILVDFRNTIIILTSNIAHDVPSYKRVEVLSKYLRPEFLNRIDDIISFSALSPESMLKVVDIHLGKTIRRAAALGLTLEVTPEGKQWFVDEIMMSKMGVRALKRIILHEVENRIANMIMRDELPADRIIRFRPGPDIEHLETF
jgi:ATP-dependent Clp protease ATP-binding subunit ClpC